MRDENKMGNGTHNVISGCFKCQFTPSCDHWWWKKYSWYCVNALLCRIPCLGWRGGSPTGWRWEVGKTLLGSSVPLGHDLVHPDVSELLRPGNWRTCSGHIFSYRRVSCFLCCCFLQRRRGWMILGCYFETQKWNWILYLLMYKWRHVKDVLGTVISKYNL